METKICTVCKCELPASLEYFYYNPKGKIGLTSRCKSCSKEYDRSHQEQAKKWREENREILKVKKHLDYLKNKENHNKKSSKYYREHKERSYELSKQWKKNNPDKIKEMSRKRYEKTKEHHKVLTRKWKQEHKEERNVAWQLRRAKKLSLEYTLSVEQWEKIKIYFNQKCCYCGKELKLTQDHFVSLADNGEYTHNNIVPCCLSCNSSKSESDFFEWYPKYKYYSKTREKKLLKFLDYKDGIQQLELVETKCITIQMNEMKNLTYY